MRTFVYVTKESDVGRTVGVILKSELHLSTSLIRRLKAQNGITLDDAAVHTGVRVQGGQSVAAHLQDRQENWSYIRKSEGSVDVVYEDEDLMIVNKPAPLPTVISNQKQGDTLEGRIYFYFGCPEHFVYRPINRLDKGTSGLMVIAKNAFAQEKLQKALHSDAFVRRYMAIAEGKLPEKSGTIDLPIAREHEETVRRVVRADGKPSVTHYRVLRETMSKSLVELQLETGRTHQIRVHLLALGCPLAGDYLYAQENPRLPGRFALHACYIKLRHPVTGEWIEREAPLPEELEKLLEE